MAEEMGWPGKQAFETAYSHGIEFADAVVSQLIVSRQWTSVRQVAWLVLHKDDGTKPPKIEFSDEQLRTVAALCLIEGDMQFPVSLASALDSRDCGSKALRVVLAEWVQIAERTRAWAGREIGCGQLDLVFRYCGNDRPMCWSRDDIVRPDGIGGVSPFRAIAAIHVAGLDGVFGDGDPAKLVSGFQPAQDIGQVFPPTDEVVDAIRQLRLQNPMGR